MAIGELKKMYRVATEISEVNLMPTTELEEILQNVKTILSTVKGTVPLDRSFGIDKKIVDLPVSVAKAKISAAIVKAINELEPRVKVRKIYYDSTDRELLDGIIKPRVDVEIVEEKLRTNYRQFSSSLF